MNSVAAPNLAKANIIRVENDRASAIISDPASATLDEIRALARHTIDGRQCVNALEKAFDDFTALRESALAGAW